MLHDVTIGSSSQKEVMSCELSRTEWAFWEIKKGAIPGRDVELLEKRWAVQDGFFYSDSTCLEEEKREKSRRRGWNRGKKKRGCGKREESLRRRCSQRI